MKSRRDVAVQPEESEGDDRFPSDAPPGASLTREGRMVIVAVSLAPLVAVAFAIAAWFWIVGSGFGLGPMMADMHETMVEENVPEAGDFDRLLTRDLELFFSERLGLDVSVRYELLRDRPSQSGPAYPKYYAWVFVFDGSTCVEEGVVRVGVADKEQFSVTHYFTADEARDKPASIREVFADDVIQKIEQKLEVDSSQTLLAY